VLESCHVSHYYGTERALCDVNLRVAKGEFVSIVGASGGGKSTLLSILSTLLRPTEGEVLLAGASITSLANLDHVRRTQIGFVFQFHYLIGYLTVFENVEIAAVDHHAERIDEVLEALDIAPIRNKYPDAISGGQRQRAAIARAIINEPKILFADEPTGNLDSKNSTKVYEIFRKLCDQGATLVVATHDPRISEVADRLVELEDGRIR